MMKVQGKPSLTEGQQLSSRDEDLLRGGKGRLAANVGW